LTFSEVNNALRNSTKLTATKGRDHSKNIGVKFAVQIRKYSFE